MNSYGQFIRFVNYGLVVVLICSFIYALFHVVKLAKIVSKVVAKTEDTTAKLQQLEQKQQIIHQNMNVGLVQAISTAIPLYFLMKPRPRKKPSNVYLLFRFYEAFKLLK